MTVINTNIAASVTANALKANQRTMENTMECYQLARELTQLAMMQQV